MKIVEIIRLECGPDGTFGVMRIDKAAFCATLEPCMNNNQSLAKVGETQKRAGCIPAQQYMCRPIESPSFGGTFEVKDVPGRSGILFHPGNVVGDTAGCILLGQSFGKLRDKRALLNSGATFREFLSAIGRQPFHLTIVDRF